MGLQASIAQQIGAFADLLHLAGQEAVEIGENEGLGGHLLDHHGRGGTGAAGHVQNPAPVVALDVGPTAQDTARQERDVLRSQQRVERDAHFAAGKDAYHSAHRSAREEVAAEMRPTWMPSGRQKHPAAITRSSRACASSGCASTGRRRNSGHVSRL